MLIKYNAKNIESSVTIEVKVEEVNQCPICKKSIKPVHLNSVYYYVEGISYFLESHLLCRGCNQSFIAHYSFKSSNLGNKTIYTGQTPYYTAPNEYIKCNYNQFITDTSPNFVEIYNQAAAAESYNLDQIAGIGYRKALEFLIKDFLIKQNPDDKSSIEKTLLGKCISTKIDNPQLKIAASRAVWLGNDQTHYIQKFNDKDIEDLKRLIRLTVHWISMILETEEAASIEPK